MSTPASFSGSRYSTAASWSSLLDVSPSSTRSTKTGQARDSSPYASAKLFGERLGKCHAESHGLSAIAVRIGYDDPLYLVGNSHIQQGLSWSNLRWAMIDSASSNWYPLTLVAELTLSSLFVMEAGYHSHIS